MSSRTSLLLAVSLFVGCATPTRWDYQLAEARRLAARGEHDAAVSVVAPLLQGPGAGAGLLAEACGWAVQAERWQEALDWSTRLLAADAGSLAGHRTRGLALLGLERPSSALQHLERAQREGPPDPAVQRALGLALEATGGDASSALALLTLSGAADNRALAARDRLDRKLHPPPPAPEPRGWARMPALDRGTVYRVLEEETGLASFLLRYQEERALAGDPRASGWRASDRAQAAENLADLPDDTDTAEALRLFVRVGLMAASGQRVRPQETMTRGRFALLVTETLRILEARPDLAAGGQAVSSFADLPSTHPDYAVAMTACTVGAMRADADRRFRPTDALSGLDLQLALEPIRGLLRRSPLYRGGSAGEGSGVDGAGNRSGLAAAAAQEPAPPQEPPAPPVPRQEPTAPPAPGAGRLAVEIEGQALGTDRDAALDAARDDALQRAIREIYRLEGLGEPLRAISERFAELERSLGGFLAARTVKEEWDPDHSLASIRLRVEADRAAFRRVAGAALRVRVVAEGPHAFELSSKVQDRLVQAGFEVLAEPAGEPPDALVWLVATQEQLPGGSGPWRAWRCALEVEVLAVSPRDGAQIRIAAARFGKEEPVYGTDAGEVARQALLPWAEQGADLAAKRILDANASAACWTVIVEGGADRRYLVEDLLEAVRKRGEAIGVLGTGGLAWKEPYAVFRVVLDRRGAGRLGGLLETLDLGEGRRVRVEEEAGATLRVRIETP